MPFLVRVRPNASYLVMVIIAAGLTVFGVARGGWSGVAVACAGGFLLVLFGYPIVASTLLRVPAVAVTGEGIGLPMMGPKLSWADIVDVRTAVKLSGQRAVTVLLIVVTRPDDVIAATRPWLRQEARSNLARFGTPIVIADASLDQPVDAILDATRRHRPPAP
jgi:hypothetical protein